MTDSSQPPDAPSDDPAAPGRGPGSTPRAETGAEPPTDGETSGPPDVRGSALAGPVRRAGRYVVAFGTGFAVMAIEIAGARVMAPVFGLSAVPWTAVIGVILAALALGNHLGGRLADGGRVPLAWILAGGGVTAALPVVGGGVPARAAAAFGFIPGAVASAVALFALPVLALGCVVPYLVRAETGSVDEVGRRAGDVSAAATVGSILGTFLTGFVLLPAFPLPILLAVIAAGLVLLAALAGVLLGGTTSPEALVTAAVLVGALGWGSWGDDGSVVHREETVHGSIQITEHEWASGRRVRELWQNGGSSSAEYVDTGEPAHTYARASMHVLRELPGPPDSILVLGGGALTLPVAMKRWRSGVTVDVVELDPAVTRLAREHFAVGRLDDTSGLRVVHTDGRRYLRAGDGRYDVIYLDVFDHLVTVPWTLVTREALTLAADRLRPGGVLVANVLSPLDGAGAAFLARFLATAETVFTEVRAFPVEPALDPGATQNVLVVAADTPEALPDTPWPRVDSLASGSPLTDAHAPVEYLQGKVFLEGLRWR